jgi:hypothetical protein
MGSSASPIVLLVLQIPGRFPVVRAKLPPLAFPSSFYPIHPWNWPQSVTDDEDD